MTVKILLSAGLMLVLVNSLGQRLLIHDDITNAPIVDVMITCEKDCKPLAKNEYGIWDLSNLEKPQKIYISAPGYVNDTVELLDSKDLFEEYIVTLSSSDEILNELVVSSYNPNALNRTSIHIEPLPLKNIDQRGTYGISDALALLPGVTQLSTGIGISKPVIRGLYGNRILVLMSGLRFDNQQWQDEHGLGLSDIGIGKLELIKGPLSILYGTDAIGGVINIIEERPPLIGKRESEVKTDFHINSMGGSIQVGHKANFGKWWYRMRLGTTNHCDYSDGNNNRVLNSRFNGQYFKTSLGFTKGKWTSENHYSMSFNKFGFIFNDILHFMDTDDRWSRNMSGPHHIVFLNTFASMNTFQLPKSQLKFNLGFQSNYRAEDEGGNELSLKMLLLTGQYALRWNKDLTDHWSLVLANNGSYENNINYGRRKIVPDANMLEETGSFYLKYNSKKITIEEGFGIGMKHIETLLTPTVNTEEKEIFPFSQNRIFYNSLSGISYLPTKFTNIKLNFSTGVRAPNLAELSANGLHEGTYAYEIGDPSMKNEQNFNIDLGVYRSGKTINLSLSGFYNHFQNYIYLQPTSEDWYGFPVYRYTQVDANIYGGEIRLDYSPKLIKGLNASCSYSTLVGELENGEFIPWMPANKVKPEIKYDKNINEKDFYVFGNTDIVMSQLNVNPNENSTPFYYLINAGIGISWHKNETKYSLNITGNNLLNEAYYDHLSRLKNFGFLNIGRDLSLKLIINFNQKTNKQS